MYRIAICEDEPLMARENEDMICRILEARRYQRDIDFSVTCFPSPEPLLVVLQKHAAAFHLLLLDIRLAQADGLELASRLRELNVDCSIIYVTAYTDYALDSFTTRPLEYLVKPVDEERMKKAVEWDLQKNYRPEKIVLPVSGGLRKVAVRDILYAEAVNHKAAVHLSDEVISVNLSFQDFLSRLPGNAFCRCHNSFAVNLKHVHKQTAYGLLLNNGIELPVSRTYRQEVSKQFIACIE